MSSLPERISEAVGEMLGFGDEPEIARVVMRVLTEAPPEQILNLVGDVEERGVPVLSMRGVVTSKVGWFVIPREEAKDGAG